MKRVLIIILSAVLVFAVSACGQKGFVDREAAIMVNDALYLCTYEESPCEPDENVIRYTTSYVGEKGEPSREGETNFDRELGTPYALLSDGAVVVLMDQEWVVFKTRNSSETGSEEKQNIIAKTDVLKEPPVLTVTLAEKKSIEACRGTYSWIYQNDDGTETGITADSVHPLDAKEIMPSLGLTYTQTSHVKPFDAYLQWDTIPDEVSMRCWPEECWRQTDAESEDIPVRILMIDSNVETEPTVCVELKDGNYIYEVVAEWNSAEKYNGTACYSFCTIKPNNASIEGNKSYTYNVAYANWTEDSGIYSRALNCEKMIISSVQHLPVYKFDTKADLDAFKTSFKDVLTMDHGLDETPSFEYITAAYDDSFFSKYSLMLAYVPASSGSFRFGVGDVYCDGQSFCMYVEQLNDPETYDAMMAGWFALVEVDKADIADCTSFDAQLGRTLD